MTKWDLQSAFRSDAICLAEIRGRVFPGPVAMVTSHATLVSKGPSKLVLIARLGPAMLALAAGCSPTPVPAQTRDLRAVVFHDINANATWDPGERLLPGVRLTTAKAACVSGSTGRCRLSEVARGHHSLMIDPPPGFPYVITPLRQASPINEGVLVRAGGNRTLMIGLVQGILTAPFDGDFPVDRYYDHEPGAGIAWWNDAAYVCPADDLYCTSLPIGTDSHSGTDFDLPAETPVLAAAPGEVVVAGGRAECFSIVLYHGSYRGGQLFTGYTHLNRVDIELGDWVGRGQPLGLSGDTCSPGYPHLHFDLFSATDSGTVEMMQMIDPYMPTVDVALGYWIRRSGPLSLPVWVSKPLEAQGPGLWTQTNLPVPPG